MEDRKGRSVDIGTAVSLAFLALGTIAKPLARGLVIGTAAVSLASGTGGYFLGTYLSQKQEIRSVGDFEVKKDKETRRDYSITDTKTKKEYYLTEGGKLYPPFNGTIVQRAINNDGILETIAIETNEQTKKQIEYLIK